MLQDISYKNYNKKDDIHGTVLYPATMIAPVQKDILEFLISKNPVRNIFDPFHGSGTALYEGFYISRDIQLIGCDINPLANLITKVKLEGVSTNIDNDIKHIKDYILNKRVYKSYKFPNSEKWFREDIAKDLTKIRKAIITIEDKQNRRFFWCMMCNVIRRYSNTRSSTYKLHIKPKEQINRMTNQVIVDYIYSIENNVEQFRCGTTNFALFKCDTLNKIKEFDDNSFDISITSPPYGDNGTTVPYGQFSMLSLYWIDKRDLELSGWEFDNYSKIDSCSMGGYKGIREFDDFELSLINPYVEKISEAKRKKVKRFFVDYFEFMQELCRVTNQFIVMTLGNRTVDRINIDLTDISMKCLENFGFKKVQIAQREILNKRTPKKTSKVNNEPVSSMNQEYVIIYKNKKLLSV